jgi:histidyl-tRNA synthetase
LAEKLRNQGINCEIMYGKISKALEYANSKALRYVIFLGKEEVKKGKIKLRDMKTGKELMINEKDLVKKLT